jgi:serine phosphatase RsbU (regulator of sigma subunit)/anti-sigma regulatory factor (Ser/Thr protein kinase)
LTAAVLVLNAGVFVRLVLRRPRPERWVALAVAFAVLEGCVTLLAPARFTPLYFAGRVAAFLSAGSLLGAVLVDVLGALRQSTLATQARRLAERAALLATISESLYESLELDVVLRTATTAPVPGFADRVTITMLEEGEEVAAAPRPDSSIVVPLQLGGQTFGTMTFAYAESGRVYRSEDGELFEEIARRVALAIDHAARFAQERRIAEGLQRTSLPATLPTIDGISLDAVYQPARADERVGGDWYDAFEVAGEKLIVTVGDVMGSGVDAAVTMNAVRQSIRGAAEVTFDPVTILNAAGRALVKNGADRIVTAFVGVLDLKSGTMTYASAGHPPACVRSNDGSISMLTSTGVPLGIAIDEVEERSRSTQLRPGDLLVLYTDGLTELHRDPISGEQELISSLRDIPDNVSAAEEIRKALIAGDPYDDVAILTLRMLGDREQCGFSCDVRDGEAAARLRRSVVDFLRAKGTPESWLFDAEVIVGELLGNVARHARGLAEVYVDFHAGAPALRVLDRGNGPPFASRAAAAAEESGRGLFLVARLGSNLQIAARPGGGSEVSVVLRANTFRDDDVR